MIACGRGLSLGVVLALFALSCESRKEMAPPEHAATPVSTGTEAASHLPKSATPAENAKVSDPNVLTGDAAKRDWKSDAPGVRRKLTTSDLPAPYATESVRNQPSKVSQPEGAWPKVPAGFVVAKFASDLSAPRMIRTAPNGDLFVAESKSDRVRILRDADGDGKAELNEIFAQGLSQPFGIAFYPPGDAPQYVYIANTGSIVRFPYRTGDTKAHGKSETIAAKVSGGGMLEGGGHWTRDIVFSKDGSKLYLSVGSKSNVDDDEVENRRARIFEYTPDGKNERVYASGIRNPVGLAIQPQTGDLWTSVNEHAPATSSSHCR